MTQLTCCSTYIHYSQFTGRSSMKQYLPLKPTKRGFKVWVEADAVTGYICDFDVYVGKPSDGVSTNSGLGERVVFQLCRPLQGGNYQVFCDNFSTFWRPVAEYLCMQNHSYRSTWISRNIKESRYSRARTVQILPVWQPCGNSLEECKDVFLILWSKQHRNCRVTWVINYNTTFASGQSL